MPRLSLDTSNHLQLNLCFQNQSENSIPAAKFPLTSTFSRVKSTTSVATLTSSVSTHATLTLAPPSSLPSSLTRVPTKSFSLPQPPPPLPPPPPPPRSSPSTLSSPSSSPILRTIRRPNHTSPNLLLPSSSPPSSSSLPQNVIPSLYSPRQLSSTCCSSSSSSSSTSPSPSSTRASSTPASSTSSTPSMRHKLAPNSNNSSAVAAIASDASVETSHDNGKAHFATENFKSSRNNAFSNSLTIVSSCSVNISSSQTTTPVPTSVNNTSSFSNSSSQSTNLHPATHHPPRRNADRFGVTRLAKAAEKGRLDSVAQAFQNAPEELDQPDNAGIRPLQRAALHGHAEVVKFLIEKGCRLDIQADNGDTPLIDAVENRHLNVVRILLNAGANPHQANRDGVRPIDVLDIHCSSPSTPRTILNFVTTEAASDVTTKHSSTCRTSPVKITSDVPSDSNKTTSSRISPEECKDTDPPEDVELAIRYFLEKSMRDHPPDEFAPVLSVTSIPQLSPAGLSLASSSRHDLLYIEPTREYLRRYAGQGDTVAVYHIMNSVKPDVSCAVAAARGGHDVVFSLILAAMENEDKDPDPTVYPETPILTAIGRGHLEVIKLILNQDEFDPTRLTNNGRTYWELSEERRGPRWVEEAALLKQKYDDYIVRQSQKSTESGGVFRKRGQSTVSPPLTAALRSTKLPRTSGSNCSGSIESVRRRSMNNGKKSNDGAIECMNPTTTSSIKGGNKTSTSDSMVAKSVSTNCSRRKKGSQISFGQTDEDSPKLVTTAARLSESISLPTNLIDGPKSPHETTYNGSLDVTIGSNNANGKDTSKMKYLLEENEMNSSSQNTLGGHEYWKGEPNGINGQKDDSKFEDSSVDKECQSGGIACQVSGRVVKESVEADTDSEKLLNGTVCKVNVDTEQERVDGRGVDECVEVNGEAKDGELSMMRIKDEPVSGKEILAANHEQHGERRAEMKIVNGENWQTKSEGGSDELKASKNDTIKEGKERTKLALESLQRTREIFQKQWQDLHELANERSRETIEQSALRAEAAAREWQRVIDVGDIRRATIIDRRYKREERVRLLESLPPAISNAMIRGAKRPINFDGKSVGIKHQFLPILTVPLGDIKPDSPRERWGERWMMSWQVVGVLGLPELDLNDEKIGFSHWEKLSVTQDQMIQWMRFFNVEPLTYVYGWDLMKSRSVGLKKGEFDVLMGRKECAIRFIAMLDKMVWVRLKDFLGEVEKREDLKHLGIGRDDAHDGVALLRGVSGTGYGGRFVEGHAGFSGNLGEEDVIFRYSQRSSSPSGSRSNSSSSAASTTSKDSQSRNEPSGNTNAWLEV